MKCPECGCECERGMRLTFRLNGGLGNIARYSCDTPGIEGIPIEGILFLPRSDDEPAEELTVYVEGVG